MFSRQEKVLLALLASMNFTHIVDFMIMMPLGPQLMRLFSISPQQFGFLVSSYTLTAGVSGFLASFFIDRFDRKASLLFFYTGFAMGTLACALADTFLVLLVSRCVAGFFGGILGSLIFSIVSDVINFERRGTAMGIVMGAFSLASVFGVPLSLFLSTHYNWHTPFLFLGFLSLLIGVIILWTVPPLRLHLEKPRPKESTWGPLWSFFQEKNLRICLLFAFCLVFGHFTVIPFISPSLVANAGLSESQLPLIYLFGGGFSLISSPWVGRLSDRFGKKRVFNWGLLVSLLPIFWITHIFKPYPLYLILFVAVVFFTTMGGRMIPAMTLISDTINPERRGRFMSIVSSVQQLASAGAAALAGALITKSPESGFLQNYNWVGYIAIFFSLVALFLLRSLHSRHETKEGV